MNFTVEWHAVGSSNTLPINQAVTTSLGNINTTFINRVEGYNLPAGSYTYTGSAHHDGNYWESIHLIDASGNLIREITSSIHNWADGGPYSGSFILNSPTTVYAFFSDQYYMDNTRLTLNLSGTPISGMDFVVEWRAVGNNTFPINQAVSTPLVNINTTYIDRVEGYDLPPGVYNYTATAQHDNNYYNDITLYNSTGGVVVQITPSIGNWQAGGPYTGTFTLNAPTTIYAKTGDQFYMYNTRVTLNLTGTAMCFLEGTKILCYNATTQQEEYRQIETLRKGDLVKTALNGYKPIDTIGTSKIYNPSNSMRSLNRLYRCSKENYPSLSEDLVITGCHSILVKNITEEERNKLLDLQHEIYVTEKHYRLIAAADQRAIPFEQEGVFNIWHFALEHPQYTFNYGVYANGLLVECSSMRMMRELSGMTLM